MKPFTRSALFCANVVRRPAGTLDILGVASQKVIEHEGPSAGAFDWPLRVFIQIEELDPRLPHVVTLRWVDESDRPLPGDGNIGRYPFGPSDSDTHWYELDEEIALELSAVRAGVFRLMIEVDGALIGWIPYRLLASRVTKGES
jgi:hypothetical protein